VAIDYPAALALRQMALVQDELPNTAGAGSERPAHYVPDLHRKMLLATLEHRRRINEALALTRVIFR
jgi:hypothetical protein